jgi:hypothetical protein
MLRHRAEAETPDLRKDEPHPVASLAPVRKFFDDQPIDWLLGLYEALEIERIAQSAAPFGTIGPSLSACRTHLNQLCEATPTMNAPARTTELLKAGLAIRRSFEKRTAT